MERSENRAPYVPVPAVVGSALMSLDLAQFGGRWIALCFLPYPAPLVATLLDSHTEQLARERTSLFAVVPDRALLDRHWISRIGKLGIPLLADPLRRLRRRFDVSRSLTRCQTIFVDPAGRIRCRLAHDLTDCSLQSILELLRASRTQVLPRENLGTGQTVACEVAHEVAQVDPVPTD